MTQLSKTLTPAEVKFFNCMKDLDEISLLSAEIPSEEGRYIETGVVELWIG